MKANPTEQELVTFAFEPDTMGCVIRSLPYIIRERAYQLFEGAWWATGDICGFVEAADFLKFEALTH